MTGRQLTYCGVGEACEEKCYEVRLTDRHDMTIKNKNTTNAIFSEKFSFFVSEILKNDCFYKQKMDCSNSRCGTY